MVEFIKKRDGQVSPFNRAKIEKAIKAAVLAVGGTDMAMAETLSGKVCATLAQNYTDGLYPSVEAIQDCVEKTLIENGHAKVAKQYILYRSQHAEMRKARAFMEGGIEAIEDYISEEDWRVNENSNMGYSLQGLNNHLAGHITSGYWLNKVYPPSIGSAHKEGLFHIHDLSTLGPYCCGWDLKDLLLKGFTGVFGKVQSKAPKRFRTALGQIVNFLYTMQGEAAGAQAFSSFDSLLAPFIRFDGLDYKAVKQAMQEFIFNMNVPTRVGFQTPFTNITMDIHCPKNMANEAVVVGGELQDCTYGEFQEEMDMLNRAFCEVMMAGDASGRIFSFPIPTYNITADMDWESDRYQLIWEMTAKYGIPYFANYVNSDLSPEDARSMCCRLRLDNRELRKRGGGLFGSNPLTGSIGVVTMNMPRMGYLSDSVKEFHGRIANAIRLAAESLELKRKVVERWTEQGLYPYSKFYLAGIKERTGQYWTNHFSTIGLIGMHEACMNLLGVGLESDEGRQFAIDTMNFMRDQIAVIQEETGNLYNLEATPGEGTSYRLARRDRKEFSDIVTSGSGEPYYSNSTQLPVGATDDLFEALEHQNDLQSLYTGGTVFHGYIGERIEDWRMARNIVRKVCNTYEIPYFDLSPTFTICPVHGYIPGEHFSCPHSHSSEAVA